MDGLEKQLVRMSDCDKWSGHLFPSMRSDSDHVSRQTIWRRYQELVDAVGLPERIGGERPLKQL